MILCTGKIAHELMDERDTRGASAAIVRVELLYPWPEAQLFSVLDRYPDAKQVWWVQEEPANMGAWNYIHIRLHRVLHDRAKLKHVARAPEREPPRAAARRCTTPSSATSSPPPSPSSDLPRSEVASPDRDIRGQVTQPS